MCGRREGRKRSNIVDPGDILGWVAEKKMNRKEVIETSGHKLKGSWGPRDSCIIPGKKEMTDCTRLQHENIDTEIINVRATGPWPHMVLQLLLAWCRALYDLLSLNTAAVPETVYLLTELWNIGDGVCINISETGLIWQVGSWEAIGDTDSQTERWDKYVLQKQSGGRQGILYLCFLTSRITTGHGFPITSSLLSKCAWECCLAVTHWKLHNYECYDLLGLKQ